jgi:DNA polymerase-3 subunit gamma/tau
MLSTAAFNAFLKTLEEPPAHVIFILATTEKHKILPTILSRCQIYDFERMTVANTVNHLKMVAEKEGIQYEEEALAVIAEKADGGMRDALSIFDQTASFAQGNITYQKVIEDLNVLDAENYFNIINLALENKVPDIMVLLNNVINKGFDGGLLINGLASHVRNVLMAKDPQTLPLLEVSEQQRQRYQQQAQNCPTPFLYKALKLMNQCDVEYRQSSNKRLLVELTLIQVAQITQPDDDGVSAGRSPKRLKSLFRKLFQTVKPEPAAQVAGAKRVSGKTDENTPLPNHSSQAKSPNEPKVVKSAQPKITLGSLSMSFSNILNDGKGTRTETQELEIKNKEEKKPFTEDDLLFQWHAMCKRMQSIDKLKGLATRMRNIIPSITTYPHVEIVAENDILQREIEDIKKRIRITLANELHNADITISIRLAKQEEIKPLLRPNELFDKIKKENPAIAKLSEVLLLDLA